MQTSNDLAKILYWACVIWPFVGVIGIFACEGAAARARCHFIVSGILIILTALSACMADNFFLSVVWSSDGLTRFLRLIIAVGAGVSTLLLTFWSPRSLFFDKSEKRHLWTLLLFHIITATAIMAVGVNNLFIALLFIVVLAALLMMGCILNQGGSSLKAGWAVFRYILLLIIMALIGAFLLAAVPVDNAPFLAQFSSVVLSLGVVLAAGLFPMSISFLRLNVEMPITLGGIGSFILSIPVIATLLRLHQIPSYDPSEPLLMALVIVSLCFILLNEQNRERSSLYLSANLLITLGICGGIFANHPEGVYISCLFMMALVIFAPLGYMVSKKETNNLSSFESWIMLGLSGFPPIGIFWACSLLMSYLMIRMPWVGIGVLCLLLIRGYVLFQRGGVFFFPKFPLTKEAKVIIGLLVLQTVLLPIFTSKWLHMIAIEFVKLHGGSS